MKKLNPKWKDAVDLLVYTDLSVSDVAKELGVAHQTVYNWRKRPEFQELMEKELNFKTKVVRDKFKRDIDKVYDRVYDIAINSDDESTSFRAGQFLLEQVLGRAPSSIDITSQQKIEQTINAIDDKDILDIFEDGDM